MKFKFDFVAQVWLQDVTIEADNYEEAKEKLLNSFSIESIQIDNEESTATIKDVSIDNNSLDYEIIAQDVYVEVDSVQYDLDEVNSLISKGVINSIDDLPTEFSFTFKDMDTSTDDFQKNLSWEIEDAILNETDVTVVDFDYEYHFGEREK